MNNRPTVERLTQRDNLTKENKIMTDNRIIENTVTSNTLPTVKDKAEMSNDIKKDIREALKQGKMTGKILARIVRKTYVAVRQLGEPISLVDDVLNAFKDAVTNSENGLTTVKRDTMYSRALKSVFVTVCGYQRASDGFPAHFDTNRKAKDVTDFLGKEFDVLAFYATKPKQEKEEVLDNPMLYFTDKVEKQERSYSKKLNNTKEALKTAGLRDDEIAKVEKVANLEDFRRVSNAMCLILMKCKTVGTLNNLSIKLDSILDTLEV